MSLSNHRLEGVAITGIGLSCALGNGAQHVWRGIRAGQSGIAKTQRLDVSALSCQYTGEAASLPSSTHGCADASTGRPPSP